MCGLSGSVSLKSGPPLSEGSMEASIDWLRRRGPDGSGVDLVSSETGAWHVLFGHTRLSIIDLSDGGAQPFVSPDSRYHLVFNGEICNYRELRSELQSLGVKFRSVSDTEVLLQALIHWGELALPRLVGMFAFAFLDRQEGTLLLGRDAFGIKPMYWAEEGASFHFASEIPALNRLLTTAPRVNDGVAARYLVYGWHDADDQTFFAGINALLPASVLKLDLNSKEIEIETWWRPSVQESFEGTFDQAAEELRELLIESVSLHLRSDVPVGAALSGGLDSSSIVSLVRHVNPSAEIHSFSYIDPDPSISEESWVDLVSSNAKTISHKTTLTSRDLFSDELTDLIQYQGEPFGSSSIFAQYKVFQLAHRNGIKVTLDGQGADELLAGYHGYPEHFLRSLLETEGVTQAAKFAKAWSGWPGRSLNALAVTALADALPGVRTNATLMKLATSMRLIPPQGASLISPQTQAPTLPFFHRERANKGRRLVEELRYSQGLKRLNQLMRVADRNSMRWSVESRVPFLTTRIAEFCLSLPEDYLLSRQGETKRVLRRAMQGIVPDQVRDRKDKVGFKANNSSWLSGSKEPQKMFDGLNNLDFIDHKAARERVQKMVEGKVQFDDLGWRMLNLAKWSEGLN